MMHEQFTSASFFFFKQVRPRTRCLVFSLCNQVYLEVQQRRDMGVSCFVCRVAYGKRGGWMRAKKKKKSPKRTGSITGSERESGRGLVKSPTQNQTRKIKAQISVPQMWRLLGIISSFLLPHDTCQI